MRRWTSTSPARIPAVVQKLEKAQWRTRGSLKRGERWAEIERQREKLNMSGGSAKRRGTRVAKALQDSREELLEIIDVF